MTMHTWHRKIRVIALGCMFLVLSATGICYCQQPDPYKDWSENIYYTVKKGDTLWDISKRYFDSPAAWPELWSRNAALHNPHWIYPGNVISLFEFSGKEPSPDQLEPTGTVGIMEKIYRFASINQVGFVRKEQVQPIGRIIKVGGDSFAFAEGDLVYVTPLIGSGYVEGDRFTVWRNEGEVLDPYDQVKKRAMGFQHRILGQLVVIQVLPDVFMAKIEKAFQPMHVGDLIMPIRQLNEDFSMVPGKVGVECNIVVSEEHKSFFGDGEVVFVDRGKDDGLEPGQVYTIYYDQKNEEAALPFLNVGQVMVLLTEQSTATCLVIKSFETIIPGAKVHSEGLALK